MTGIAFASSPKIVGNLMAIENIERLFTIVDGPNNKQGLDYNRSSNVRADAV